MDIGNAHVFVRAADLDLTGTETAAEIDADQTLCERLETIRAHAAHAMGMVEDPERALAQSLAVPMLALVAPPQDYRNVSGGETVSAKRCDLLARLMFMQQAHKAYAATGTVCTGVASRLRGTVVKRFANEARRHLGAFESVTRQAWSKPKPSSTEAAIR